MLGSFLGISEGSDFFYVSNVFDGCWQQTLYPIFLGYHVFTEDGVDSSDFFACSDASDYEDQTRNLVRKLRNRTLEVRLVRIDVGWWDPRVQKVVSQSAS